MSFHTLYASLSHKNRILFSTQNNRSKSHPLQSKYYPHSNAAGIHAEVGCLIKYVNRQLAHQARGGRCLPHLRDCVLHVWRYTKDGQLALAKPCSGCELAIREFRVGQVFYSSKEGWREL